MHTITKNLQYAKADGLGTVLSETENSVVTFNVYVVLKRPEG